MIQVVLVDDEHHCTESLSLQLKKLGRDIDILGQFTNPFSALEFLKTNPADIVFLDVEMPGMNGFELLNQLPDASFEVVFTTAYDEFAIKAFKISAFDYLLKPIAIDDLNKCIENWQKNVQKITINQHLDKLMEVLSAPRSIPNKIALPTGEGLEFVLYRDIVRIESDSNYSILYFQDGRKLVVCRTLKEMEELLQDFNFIRIHNSHIINPEYLQRFVRQDGGYVVMTDGSVISVSRSRKDFFLNRFPGA